MSVFKKTKDHAVKVCTIATLGLISACSGGNNENETNSPDISEPERPTIMSQEDLADLVSVFEDNNICPNGLTPHPSFTIESAIENDNAGSITLAGNSRACQSYYIPNNSLNAPINIDGHVGRGSVLILADGADLTLKSAGEDVTYIYTAYEDIAENSQTGGASVSILENAGAGTYAILRKGSYTIEGTQYGDQNNLTEIQADLTNVSVFGENIYNASERTFTAKTGADTIIITDRLFVSENGNDNITPEIGANNRIYAEEDVFAPFATIRSGTGIYAGEGTNQNPTSGSVDLGVIETGVKIVSFETEAAVLLNPANNTQGITEVFTRELHVGQSIGCTVQVPLALEKFTFNGVDLTNGFTYPCNPN